MADRSFPRSRRVRRHAEFQRIQGSDPEKATSRHFVFLVARTLAGQGAPSRLGLVVTKKIGGAVARNRVKRVCRECFRLWPDFVPAGVDLIVIARQGADTLGLEEVRQEWARVQGVLRHRVRDALAREAPRPHVPSAPPPAPRPPGKHRPPGPGNPR